MKKIFLAAAICAGILAFANTEFAEAADLQAQEATSLVQSTDVDTQQLSSRTDDKDPD